MADFFLIARRTLDARLFQLFRFHYLLGADWRLCSRRLGMDRGTFFHAVYRIERKLGKAFAETQPYGLYPLDEYFGGVVREEPVKPLSPIPMAARHPRIPLLKAA